MEKGKTIKQIADEIGVSKQAVQKRISREPLKSGVYASIDKIDGTIYIAYTGEMLIKRAFLGDDYIQNKSVSIDASIPVSIDTSIPMSIPMSIPNRQKDDDILAVLKATIDTLQGQLEVKDKRIDELTAELAKEREHGREREQEIAVLADQAQKLQLAQMKQPLLAGEEATAQEEQPKKKGLFGKIFSKK